MGNDPALARWEIWGPDPRLPHPVAPGTFPTDYEQVG